MSFYTIYKAHGGLIALLTSIVVLYLFISAPPQIKQYEFGNEPSRDVSPRTVHENIARVAVPFGAVRNGHNFSSAAYLRTIFERDETDDIMHYLRCKGQDALDYINTGQPRIRLPTQQDIDYAWSIDFQDFTPDLNLVPALNDLDIPHHKDDAVRMIFHQDKVFRLAAGGRPYPPTNAWYDNAYIFSGIHSTIIGQVNVPPVHVAEPNMVPQLSKWTDVVSFAWNEVTGGQRSQLRYVIHQNIASVTTRGTMEILEGIRNNPGTLVLPWPGHLYDIRSQEGLALMGTPHGQSLSWLISGYGARLDKRVLNVCIFTEGTLKREAKFAIEYFIIWQLRYPAGVRNDGDPDRVRTCREMV